MVGFWRVELKLLGPVQAYVAPATSGVERFSVVPAHRGPLFEAVGVAGRALTTTVVVPATLVQPATVMVTLYVPEAAVVTLAIVGFWRVELKLLGPVHAYVAPATRGVERFSVVPAHRGPLLDAVGVAGTGFITTVVVPATLVQPATVTVTLYVPAAAAVTLAIVGFWSVELKLLGPVHAYVAPATRGVERLSVVPAHSGPLLDAVGVAGTAFTTTVVVPATLVQPATVTVTLYVPEAAVVTLAIEGFWRVELKLLGPVHAYVAPATRGVERLSVAPAHSGPSLDAVGVAGTGFITTVVVPATLVQPATVMVTLYVPEAAVVTLAIVGFWSVELKLLGPVHAYVAPATRGVERFSVVPAHSGPLLDAVGVAGTGFITTVVVPATLVQPATVTVTL